VREIINDEYKNVAVNTPNLPDELELMNRLIYNKRFNETSLFEVFRPVVSQKSINDKVQQ